MLCFFDNVPIHLAFIFGLILGFCLYSGILVAALCCCTRTQIDDKHHDDTE